MEIRQFRVVLRARDFDSTCRFYADVLALPALRTWDHGEGRAALYRAGGGLIEVRGRPRAAEGRGRDEAFDYQGPDHKLTLTLLVPSAEQAYQELLHRHPNIPGGLQQLPGGTLAFETHDPDGVKILLAEPED